MMILVVEIAISLEYLSRAGNCFESYFMHQRSFSRRRWDGSSHFASIILGRDVSYLEVLWYNRLTIMCESQLYRGEEICHLAGYIATLL